MTRVLALLLFSFSATAQQISGFITDSFGEPLPGAYVSTLDGRHAHAGDNGSFTIAATAGDTLTASFVGYADYAYVVGAAPGPHRIALTAATIDLGTVTVGSSDRPHRIAAALDLRTNPVVSGQEVLRSVPGLFIGQHAGGGKAEQIFLRGFDIDHGTDVAISVDGTPVNMASHAHGQGYADLHFLIPESIGQVEFAKGTYAADRGNFATAGHVDFRTRNRVDGNGLKVEAGSFGQLRGLLQLQLLATERQNAYVMGEYLVADGPFEAPQDFRRGNVFAKFTTQMRGDDRLTLTAAHFSSSWDASGQIPVRAVERGLIGRFGAIDPTEGGTTGREQFALTYVRNLDRATFVRTRASYVRYRFDLHSNFTFFLEDPVNGDQIRQRETRDQLHVRTTLHHGTEWLGRAVALRGGVSWRGDRTQDSYLANTVDRYRILDYVQRGDVAEDNFGVFADAEIDLGRLTLRPGVRYDHFRFGYTDALAARYANLTDAAGRLSPKLRSSYVISPDARVYLNLGQGFHSNDSRAVALGQVRGALPAARGADLGVEAKLLPRLLVNAALWHLYLDQEFVYVGDAGIVEPSGRTRRSGVDLSLRYQLGRWLTGYADGTYAHARAIDEEDGADLIPLAPRFTLAGGLTGRHKRWAGGVRVRALTDRPANEDNSIVAEGYFVADANVSYRTGRLTLGLDATNLTDTRWNEAQFATESRLAGEAAPVEEIHFTPGAPFGVFARIAYGF